MMSNRYTVTIRDHEGHEIVARGLDRNAWLALTAHIKYHDLPLWYDWEFE